MDMMMGGGIETSLFEAGVALFTILLILIAVGVVVGVACLPLFYLALAYMNLWYRTSDEGSSSGLIRKSIIRILNLALPILSLASTVFILAYYGGFGLFQGLPPGKKGPIQVSVENQFDGMTRRWGEQLYPTWPKDIEIDPYQIPNKAWSLIQPVNREDNQAVAEHDAKIQKLIQDHLNGTLVDDIPEDGTAITLEMINQRSKTEREIMERAFRDTVQDGIIFTQNKQDTLTRSIRAFLTFLMMVFGPIPLCTFISSIFVGKRTVVLILRSLGRNFLRTSLTYLAIFVLVWLIAAVWSVLWFVDALTQEKDANFKAIITEKFQIPSQMKPSHLETLKQLIGELPPEQRPPNIEDNMMTWAFVGGTLDPTKRTPQNSLFFFCTEPENLLKMMPGLEDLTGEQLSRLKAAADKMANNPRAVVIGQDRLKQLGKRVGDRMKLTSLNYKDIEFEVEVVEAFPTGTRYEQSAVMNRKYLDNELDAYRGRKGEAHPLADKCMNLIWIRLPNKQAFESLAGAVNSSGKFSPAVKMEIESSAYASFLAPMKDYILFMRYVFAPGLLMVMTLVISLVVSIGVRERRTEMAVLKVLGFRPWMVVILVLGEALLIGTLSGFLATAAALAFSDAMGGFTIPQFGMFGKFFIPTEALWWGPAIGGFTAMIGTILPSRTAQKIKVSEVFSRIA